MQNLAVVEDLIGKRARLQPLGMPYTSAIESENSAAVVLSHPGWSRRYLAPESGAEMERWCEKEAVRFDSIKTNFDLFAKVILPKLWMAEHGHYGLLLAEAMCEHAHELAAYHELPSIITVPCIVSVSAGRPSVTPAELPGQTYCSYLEAFYRAKPDTYVLPTTAFSGALLGFNHERTADELWNYAETPAGRALLNPLLPPQTKQLKFCGAFFDECMLSTISHVIGRTEIGVLDRLSLSSGSVDALAGKMPEVFFPSSSKIAGIAAMLREVVNGGDYSQTLRAIVEIFAPLPETTNNWPAYDVVEKAACDRFLQNSAETQCFIHPDVLHGPGHVPLDEAFFSGQAIDKNRGNFRIEVSDLRAKLQNEGLR